MASASGLWNYLDLGANPLLESGYMGNNAYHLAVLLHTRKGFQSGIEGFLVQRAKSFIKEERIHSDILAGHMR